MKWYILYGRAGLPPLMGHPELDSAWSLLLCNSEDEALALSRRLLENVYIVREVGTVLRGERQRTKDAAAILSHCATGSSSRAISA